VENISFIGCGSWGAALSKVLSDKNIQSTMWHRSKSIVDKMSSTRKHYLVPDLTFSKKVFFTNDLDSLIEESSILVLAIPSQSIRSVIEPKKHLITNDKILVNLAKGIEIDTLMTISGVLHDILGNDFNNIVALSGPSHAEEVIFGHPTTLVSASKNEESAAVIQEVFSNNTLRTYKNHDILGVELGGAMKNVIAIAAGICDGIGYGDNSKAALLTRGMGEISKLGSAMGAESLTFDIESPFGKAISIALYSENNNELLSATKILKDYMINLNMMKNIESSDQKGLKEIKLKLKNKAYQMNLSTAQILNEIRNGFYGFESQRLQIGTDEVKIWIRYDKEDRNSIYDLENMRINIMDNNYLVSDLVDIKIERDLLSIDHLNGKRSVQIDADLLNPKLDNPITITTNVEEFINSNIKSIYPSIKHSVEGQIRSQAETGKSLGFSGPIVLILMLTIILFTFRSLLQTFAVFILIPFGFIGVGWGHFIHDFQLSMFSYFGMIALIGILVNDSLVFISKFNKNLKEGLKFEDALTQTGLSRFRPIILTSITTVAGLAPLIFEKELQAQFLIPMAIAIAYGLILATLLTLLFLPAFLKITNRIRFTKEWIFSGKELSEEDREPAIKEMEYEKI